MRKCALQSLSKGTRGLHSTWSQMKPVFIVPLSTAEHGTLKICRTSLTLPQSHSRVLWPNGSYILLLFNWMTIWLKNNIKAAELIRTHVSEDVYGCSASCPYTEHWHSRKPWQASCGRKEAKRRRLPHIKMERKQREQSLNGEENGKDMMVPKAYSQIFAFSSSSFYSLDNVIRLLIHQGINPLISSWLNCLRETQGCFSQSSWWSHDFCLSRS